MKLLVIGQFCYDVAHLPGGEERERLGGIIRCVETLAPLMGRDGAVIPVFGVPRADQQAVLEHLGRLPGVDTSALFKTDGPANRVHLYPGPSGGTVACSRDIAPPIPYPRIRRSLSVDGILINMMSGNDITLETMDHIRMAVREHGIPIHFDFHNLTMGVGPEHERFRRPVPEWRRWAFMTDSVQVTEEELLGLPPDPMSEEQMVGHLLTLSIKGVVVTRGRKGASLYRSEHKQVHRQDAAVTAVNGLPQSAGAGDVFGSLFLYHTVKTRDMGAALEKACAGAAEYLSGLLAPPEGTGPGEQSR